MSVEKALAIACYGESVAAFRYRTLAERAPTPRHEAVFNEMAEEEQGHHQALSALLAKEFPGSEFLLTPEDKAAVIVGPRMLDIGCGAGMDLLLAARKVGSQGKAIGVDMTDAMMDRARQAATDAELPNVEVRKGDATNLPVPDASVDVVISNGVLNLVPEKGKAFQEIVRVLRPGGRVQIADIVVEAELSEDIRRNIDLWTG